MPCHPKGEVEDDNESATGKKEEKELKKLMTEIEKEYGPLDSKGNSREQSGVFAPSESGEEE